ncbi:MAG: hypothetical protein HFE43_07980 [Oscillospiraceae bacterium]|nr:hypothetical protein [Oscillospiraceae bacterium]
MALPLRSHFPGKEGDILASYKDINDYRRRKKIKQIAVKLILVSAVLGLLFVTLNLLQAFQGNSFENMITRELSVEIPDFPLTIKNEQPIDLYSLGGNFAVLTKANLLVYSSGGTRIASYNHGYTNPVVKEGEKRLLTYDRGGTKLRVDAAAGSVGEITTGNTIICAEIAPNGNVAVATSYRNHAPVITVYNSSLKEIYHYTESRDFTALAFSEDGGRLAACTVETRQGLLCAVIYEMEISKKTPARVTEITNILPLGLAYQSDGGLVVTGRNRLARLEPSDQNRMPQFTEYTGEIQRFFQVKGQTVLLQKNLFNSDSTLCVYSSSGVLKASCGIAEEAADLYTDGERILVLGKKQLHCYDMKLKAGEPILLNKAGQKVIFSGRNAFVMSTDNIDRYDID